jgi:predicted secreted protein
MAKIHGKGGDVDTGSSVTGINAWSLSYAGDVAETTDFAAAGVKTFIAGPTGWNGTFSGYKDGAPIAINSSVSLSLEEVANSGTEKYTGTALVHSYTVDTNVDGVVTYSYTFQGTGALTVATG